MLKNSNFNVEQINQWQKLNQNIINFLKQIILFINRIISQLMQTGIKNLTIFQKQSAVSMCARSEQNFSKNFDIKNGMVFTENQNAKVFIKGYLTPNCMNQKYVHKNYQILNTNINQHIIEPRKSNGFGQYIFSNRKQQVSVKNSNSTKTCMLKLQSQNKFIPKFKHYRQIKRKNQIQKRLNQIKSIDYTLVRLEQNVNAQIGQIDNTGKLLLKQLNDKFTDVIKFLNWQKQNCIQLILDKVDSLKQPLHKLKGDLNKIRWNLDTIESKLNLLKSQQVNSSDQFIAQTIFSYNQKINTIIKRQEQLKMFLSKSQQQNKRASIDQMGCVQNIVQMVYKKFFSRNYMQPQQINREDKNGKFLILLKKESENIISSIKRNKNSQSLKNSNKSLQQELQTIQNTFNKNELQDQISLNQFLTDQQKGKNIQIEDRTQQRLYQIVSKRASHSTNFSSVKNLRY